jgi:shikimate kinase
MKKKIIILAGFMGSGKTTVGKLLAKNLRARFYDLDTIIEKKNKLSIAKIFEKYGEKYFREQETIAIKEILAKIENKSVIALGGGSLETKKNYYVLKKRGTIFYLRTPFCDIIDRLKKEPTKRPLFMKLKREQLKELLRERKKTYKLAHIIVCTNNKTPIDIASKIENSCK